MIRFTSCDPNTLKPLSEEEAAAAAIVRTEKLVKQILDDMEKETEEPKGPLYPALPRNEPTEKPGAENKTKIRVPSLSIATRSLETKEQTKERLRKQIALKPNHGQESEIRSLSDAFNAKMQTQELLEMPIDVSSAQSASSKANQM
jgi:hypothetical protein